MSQVSCLLLSICRKERLTWVEGWDDERKGMLEAAVKRAAAEAQGARNAARDAARAKKNKKLLRGGQNSELRAAKANVPPQTCAWALNRLKNIVSLSHCAVASTLLEFPLRVVLRC